MRNGSLYFFFTSAIYLIYHVVPSVSLPVSLPQPAVSLPKRPNIELPSSTYSKNEMQKMKTSDIESKWGGLMDHRQLDTLKIVSYYDGKECPELYWLNFAAQHLYSKVYNWCINDDVVMESCDFLSDIAVQTYQWMNYGDCQLSNITDYELISTSHLNLLEEQTKLDFHPSTKVTKEHLQYLMTYEMQKAVLGKDLDSFDVDGTTTNQDTNEVLMEVETFGQAKIKAKQFDFTHLDESLVNVYERSTKREMRLKKIQKRKQNAQKEKTASKNHSHTLTEELELAFGCFTLTSFLCLGVLLGTKYAKFATEHGRR